MKAERKTLPLALIAGALVASLSSPAVAHGEKKPARTVVMQAIALMRNDPSKTTVIQDLMRDALMSKDQNDVDRSKVEEAITAFDAGGTHEAQDLLEISIGAAPHRVVASVNPEPAMPAPAEPSPEGTDGGVGPMMMPTPAPIIHERPFAGGFRAPGSAFDALAIASALFALVAGGLIAWRVR